MSCFAKMLATLSVLALLVPAVGLAAGEEKAAEVVPCADCHDTVAAAFALSPHARALGRDVADGAVCASCHAGGAAHAEASGDKTLITTPRGAAGAPTCLSCHGGQKSTDIDSKGMHATRGVHCDSCHSIHGAAQHADALLRSEGSTLCVSCHPAVRGSFRKPYTHSMHESVDGSGKAGMQCASCHNPHGRNVEQSLLTGRAGEIACLTCHTEKSGPFVFSHGSMVVGGCLACHEPHGSTNPMMLTRSRVAQVCLECHTSTAATKLGSQPPSFHDLRSPRYQNCTTCHTAVHGSNTSPTLLR